MRQDFEGGVYWDELAEICSEISRAAGFRGAARFRGNTVIRMFWIIVGLLIYNGIIIYH